MGKFKVTSLIGEKDELIDRLLAEYRDMPDQRMTSIVVDGKKYWIKRFNVEPVFIGHYVHKFAAKFFREPIFAPTPLLSGKELMENEISKHKRFKAAGISVPDILYEGDNFIIMPDVGLRLERVVKSISDPAEIDELYVQWVLHLKDIHKAGLCHGRPHLRDVTVDVETNKWTFLDFEQTPELVMPLEAAQARDFFICMLFLALHFNLPETPKRAFDLYMEGMPDEIPRQLKIVAKTFAVLGKMDGLFRRINPGNDVVRFAKTIKFLNEQL